MLNFKRLHTKSMKKAIILVLFILCLTVVVSFAIYFFSSTLLSSLSIFHENINKSETQPSVTWGAYTGNTLNSFYEFEKKIGKKPDINAVFINWNDAFPKNIADPLKTNGQTILIYWEQYGVSLDQVASGSTDSYINKFILDVKNYGAPVILVPLHEMNGNWDPWDGTIGTNTPDKIIIEWKHIHDLFTTANVTNVKWAWDVNNNSVPDTPKNSISVYYPGDDYVDYVGVDGFNFGNPWENYDQLFSKSLTNLYVYKKPIFIFSIASADGQKKAVWIKDALSKIYGNPKIVGWIWFNEDKERDWRVWSDENSLKAFQSGIK